MTDDTLKNLSMYLADDATLERAVLTDLFAMSDLVDRIQRRIRQLAESTGMPALQFFVLEQLALAGGAAGLGDLLAELNVPKQSGTYIIDQLEKAGFVERRRDPHDRRRFQVALTEAGEAFLQEHLTPFYTAMTRAVAAVPAPERKGLIRGLATLDEAL